MNFRGNLALFFVAVTFIITGSLGISEYILIVLNGNPSSWTRTQCTIESAEKVYSEDCTQACVFYSFVDNYGQQIHSNVCSKCTSEMNLDLMLGEFGTEAVAQCWYRQRVLGYAVRFDMKVYSIIHNLEICTIVFSGVTFAFACWAVGEVAHVVRTTHRDLQTDNQSRSIEIAETNKDHEDGG